MNTENNNNGGLLDRARAAVPPEGVEWLMAICREVEKAAREAAREAAENEVNERVHKMLEKFDTP